MDAPKADQLCECGHEKRKHFFVGGNVLGSCLHWSSSAEEYCDCEEFRLKKEGKGGRTEGYKETSLHDDY